MQREYSVNDYLPDNWLNGGRWSSFDWNSFFNGQFTYRDKHNLSNGIDETLEKQLLTYDEMHMMETMLLEVDGCLPEDSRQVEAEYYMYCAGMYNWLEWRLAANEAISVPGLPDPIVISNQ